MAQLRYLFCLFINLFILLLTSQEATQNKTNKKEKKNTNHNYLKGIQIIKHYGVKGSTQDDGGKKAE